jgi:hypothetical protein
MNYQEERLNGVVSTLAAVVQAGYEYGTAAYDARIQDAHLTLANAQNTATAREDAIEAKYAASRAAIQGGLDVERQKRYLIIGAAIGIPVLLGLVLMKRARP